MRHLVAHFTALRSHTSPFTAANNNKLMMDANIEVFSMLIYLSVPRIAINDD